MKLKLAPHQIYMDGKQGPFRCHNCEYYVSADSCNQKDIIALAGKEMYGLSMKGEFARVDPNGCSDYFKKK